MCSLRRKSCRYYVPTWYFLFLVNLLCNCLACMHGCLFLSSNSVCVFVLCFYLFICFLPACLCICLTCVSVRVLWLPDYLLSCLVCIFFCMCNCFTSRFACVPCMCFCFVCEYICICTVPVCVFLLPACLCLWCACMPVCVSVRLCICTCFYLSRLYACVCACQYVCLACLATAAVIVLVLWLYWWYRGGGIVSSIIMASRHYRHLWRWSGKRGKHTARGNKTREREREAGRVTKLNASYYLRARYRLLFK